MGSTLAGERSDDQMCSTRGHVRGFTVVEMLIVIALIGILTSLSFPRIAEMQATASVRSAKQEVVTHLNRARSAAIQHGRQTAFVRSGNVITVTIDSSGTQRNYGPSADISVKHGVQVLATRNVISFDARGFAVGLGATEKLNFTRRAASDSICIDRLGTLLPRRCSL